MTKHVIKVEGEAALGAKLSSALLRDLLDVLVDATRQTIRLRAEGRSTAPGTDPEWLIRAADFEVLGFEAGSTEIVCEAPPLETVAPEAFKQRDMFDPVDTQQTGFALFEEALSDVQRGRTDSDKYDDKVLETLDGLKKVFRQGVRALSLGDGGWTRIERDDLERYSDLRRSIPTAERVRVSGIVDSLTASRSGFVMQLDDEAAVRGRFDEQLRDDFQSLWGERAVVVGVADFKPSGAVRHVEAERVSKASERDSLWSKMPRATQTEFKSVDFRKPAASKGGLSALVGSWPGDEDDETVNEALRKLS